MPLVYSLKAMRKLVCIAYIHRKVILTKCILYSKPLTSFLGSMHFRLVEIGNLESKTYHKFEVEKHCILLKEATKLGIYKAGGKGSENIKLPFYQAGSEVSDKGQDDSNNGVISYVCL